MFGTQINNFDGKPKTMGSQAKSAKEASRNKGGRPKRTGKNINKAFLYDAGDETNVRLQMLYNGLMSKGWIRDDTDLRSFLGIFSSKPTTCRIVWTGGISTLAWLFKQMVDVNHLVQLPEGESIWVMVNARFWEKEGNKEFGNKRLGSTQPPVDNKDFIDLLVRVMNPEVPLSTLKREL